MLGFFTLEFKPPRPAEALERLVFAKPLLDLLTGILMSPVFLANRSEALSTVAKATSFTFGQPFRRADPYKGMAGELCRASGRMHLLLVLARTPVTGVSLLHVIERRRGLPRMPVITVLPDGSKPAPRVKLGQPFFANGAVPVPAGSRKGEVGIAEMFSALVKISDLGRSAWCFPVLVFVCNDRSVLPRLAPATVGSGTLPSIWLVLLGYPCLVALPLARRFIFGRFGRGPTLTALVRARLPWRLSSYTDKLVKPAKRGKGSRTGRSRSSAVGPELHVVKS